MGNDPVGCRRIGAGHLGASVERDIVGHHVTGVVVFVHQHFLPLILLDDAFPACYLVQHILNGVL